MHVFTPVLYIVTFNEVYETMVASYREYLYIYNFKLSRKSSEVNMVVFCL